jgi:hypothetical protein
MDIGQKTLGQLSAERNDKKYVTLETAAKLSGYTKDYLERLCRLGKIEYRIWNNGQYVPELESLLKETHTILVSYEGVQIVNKDETVEAPITPVAEVLPEITPTESTRVSDSKRDELTFVVRPVFSRVEQHAQETPSVDTASAKTRTEPRLPSVFGGTHISVPVSSGENEEWKTMFRTSGSVPADRLPAQGAVVDAPEPVPITSIPVAEVTDPIPRKPELPHEDSSVIQPATHLEIFDAEMLARHRTEREQHADAVPALIANETTETSLPTPATSNLPILAQEHHLVPVDPHPISRSPAFNLALIALIALGIALIGSFGVAPDQAAERTAEGVRKDLVASVAELFSDEVIVEETQRGTIRVVPVFHDHMGEDREFLLVPVQN